MATAETMKIQTTTQPLISDESSDKDESELHHEDGYITIPMMSYLMTMGVNVMTAKRAI